VLLKAADNAMFIPSFAPRYNPRLRSETSPDHLCLCPTNNEDRMTAQRGRAMFLNAAHYVFDSVCARCTYLSNLTTHHAEYAEIRRGNEFTTWPPWAAFAPVDFSLSVHELWPWHESAPKNSRD